MFQTVDLPRSRGYTGIHIGGRSHRAIDAPPVIRNLSPALLAKGSGLSVCTVSVSQILQFALVNIRCHQHRPRSASSSSRNRSHSARDASSSAVSAPTCAARSRMICALSVRPRAIRSARAVGSGRAFCASMSPRIRVRTSRKASDSPESACLKSGAPAPCASRRKASTTAGHSLHSGPKSPVSLTPIASPASSASRNRARMV